MATAVKTVPATALITLQQVAASAVVVGTAVAVNTTIAASVSCHFGRDNTGTPTGGARIRIEGSFSASDDRAWFPLHTWQSGIVLAATQAVTAIGHAHPGKVLTLGSAAGIVAGDVVLIKNATLANSEWARVTAITASVDMNVEENLANDQDNSNVYDQAHIFPPFGIDLMTMALKRVRAVVDFASLAHNQTALVEVLLNTTDSFG